MRVGPSTTNLRLAGNGIFVGLTGALAAASVIATLLFAVPARDPVTFVTLGGAVTFVAFIACTIPAFARCTHRSDDSDGRRMRR